MHVFLIFFSKFYYLFFYFVIYAFLGWSLEVLYAAKKKGGFINRGFLNGPFCPIYGFGALSIIVLLDPFKSAGIILVISCFIIPSAIEYFTGFVLEKAFSTTWWDYSKNKFNLNGRICLKFSIIWTFVSLFLILFFHPHVIAYIVNLIPVHIGKMILLILFSYFIIDVIVTLNSLIKLKHLFSDISNISIQIISKIDSLKNLNMSSNHEPLLKNIAENINYKVSNITSKFESELKSKLSNEDFDSLKKVQLKLSSLTDNYDSLVEKAATNYSRLFKAYPNLKPKFKIKALQEIHEKIKNLKK
ncbi:MAG: putative ABC transporter permease [Clostridium sp.]|nr:putative ABC transporter permease [Clostridium sp.]